MARDVTALAGIIDQPKRDHDWTLDLYVGADSFHLATSPLTAVHGFDYVNWLENVSQVRQTFTAPIDKVSVTIQNKDRVIGQHYAAHTDAWRNATCVIGRYYYQKTDAGDRTGVTAWIEMFRGTVQQPDVDDMAVTFDIVPDVMASGEIVANRNLGGPCGFVFKDPKTCAYSGPETTCDHHLKSIGGCKGRSNTHHFGGTEHYQDPDTSGTPPGTGSSGTDLGGGGGGDGSGIDTEPPCPRPDQYVRVMAINGTAVPMRAGLLSTDDWLWNPKLRAFRKVRSVEIVRGQAIWGCETFDGQTGYSSGSHPIISSKGDDRGTAVQELKTGDHVLTEEDDRLLVWACERAWPTGEFGDVVRIELEGETDEEKIYCYSDDPELGWIVCHNNKRAPGDDRGGYVILQ